MIFKSLLGKLALWQRREPPYFKVKRSKETASALLLEVYYQLAMWDIPPYCRKKPKQISVWGIINSFLRCTGFTHICRNKTKIWESMCYNQRHCLTKLFWDTSQFPALPATAWCSGHCTEPRESTWPALQPYSRSKCPNPTWGWA